MKPAVFITIVLALLLVPAPARAKKSKGEDKSSAAAPQGDEGAGTGQAGAAPQEQEGAGESEGGEKKAAWKQQADDLHLGKAGLISDILWGKIPADIQEAAGGKVRPPYFKWPVPGGRFGRGFGSGKGGKHKALDIVAPTGTPVLAATYGLVVWADAKKGYGNTIIILHPGGWVTLYAHLSKYFVKRGMKVKGRQKIGAVGSTGISRGPHLHFMFFDNGVLRDPAPLMHPSIPHPPHVPPMPFMGHTVKKGQTAAKIAELYGVDVDSLLDVNGMKDGEPFQAGWRIIIPKKIGQKKFEKGYYTVKKGDTLAAIAVLYDVSVKQLIALNDMKKDSILQLGMKIKLPEGVYDGKAMSSLGGGDDEALQQPLDDYVVKEGDSLFMIAKKFDTSIAKITAINAIKNPDYIKPGTKIQVPSKKKKTKASKGKGGKKGGIEAVLGGSTGGAEEVLKELAETPDFNPLTEEELDLTKVEDLEGDETGDDEAGGEEN
jgi:murein DD-endopeptidase MepM/ murein hydrolase activator NlpD